MRRISFRFRLTLAYKLFHLFLILDSRIKIGNSVYENGNVIKDSAGFAMRSNARRHTDDHR